VRIDIYLHNGDDELKGRLVQIQSSLEALLKRSGAMAGELKALQDRVTEVTTVEQSAITLIQGLKQQLDAAIASGDPAALQALSDQLGTSDATLAKAITDNTPAASPPPAAA